MDNSTMFSQTIRFQRTAWQNSLAIMSAVQQHGDKLLRTTIQQNPWIPGDSKKACLLWADIWTKNLAGMTDLVDKNLADMERLSSSGDQATKKEKPQKKTLAKPQELPQPSAAAKKPISERKAVSAKPQAAEKEMAPIKPVVAQPVKPVVEQPAKPAVEQVAAVKPNAPRNPIPDQSLGKHQAGLEKPVGPKV